MRVATVSAMDGCTLTRASFTDVTPDVFQSQGMYEIGMHQYYASCQEARMAGYRESNLMSLMMGNIKNIKSWMVKSKITPTKSIIQPYVTMQQRRNVNSNYWKVASGTPAVGAGTGSVPVHAWDLVIQNHGQTYGTTLPVADLYRYFLPGHFLNVEYVDTTGTARQLVYKITASATNGSNVTTVTVVPNVSEAGWGAYTAAQKLPFQIGGLAGGNAEAGTIGIVLGNSVSDYESYTYQGAAENSLSLINFFLQTFRRREAYSDAYMQAMAATMVSPYFQTFRELPLAKQRAERMRKWEAEILASLFWGDVINEFQTPELFRGLPQVVDTDQPDCVLEYKANLVGYHNLLNQGSCTQRTDHSGNALNLDTVFTYLYNLKRAREADGNSVDTVDGITDRFTFGRTQAMLIKLLAAKYGVVSHREYSPNQPLNFSENVKWDYDMFKLPADMGGVNFALFTDRFFDDKLSAAANSNAQRQLWLPDFTDFKWGIAGTNQAARRTNVNDRLYQDQININEKHIMHNSMTCTAIVEDPARHRIMKNFADACPTLTVGGCSLQPVENVA